MEELVALQITVRLEQGARQVVASQTQLEEMEEQEPIHWELQVEMVLMEVWGGLLELVIVILEILVPRQEVVEVVVFEMEGLHGMEETVR
jgi:hypothetical protein